MAATLGSKRTVFRSIADRSYSQWPVYRDFPAYDRANLAGLREDVRTVADHWFRHDQHDDIDEFVCELPLAYFDFAAHDPAASWHADTYPMEPLVRAFLLKELHGWDHETTLERYLATAPVLTAELGVETVPDQSTLWRTWHERFSPDLRETIEQGARSILHRAAAADVSTPRDPEPDKERRDAPGDPDQRAILARAGTLTNQAKRLLFPAFGFERAENRQIHEHAFWELQTYSGLREGMAVNEGARSFLVDSTRDQTPLGHVHRHHLRRLSIDEIREMYHEAIGRIVDDAAQTSAFHRYATVAIDTTEADPFTGDRTGHEDEILGTKENSDEYAYQWASIQIVGNHPPVVLDALPVVKGEGPTQYVPELLDSAQDLINIDLVLMDREFDGERIDPCGTVSSS